jgi:hypothetical protein
VIRASKKGYKLMYGVFASYEDAQKALYLLNSTIRDEFFPIIELLGGKQDIYNANKKLQKDVYSIEKIYRPLAGGGYIEDSRASKAKQESKKKKKSKKIVKKMSVYDKVFALSGQKREPKVVKKIIKTEVKAKQGALRSTSKAKESSDSINKLKSFLKNSDSHGKSSSNINTKTKYFIDLGRIKQEKYDWFIKRYSIGSNHKKVVSKDNSEYLNIVIGEYKTKKEALKAFDTFHPKIKSNLTISSVKSYGTLKNGMEF